MDAGGGGAEDTDGAVEGPRAALGELMGGSPLVCLRLPTSNDEVPMSIWLTPPVFWLSSGNAPGCVG